MELKLRKQITNSHILYDGTQPQSSSSFVNGGSLKLRKLVNNNLPKFNTGVSAGPIENPGIYNLNLNNLPQKVAQLETRPINTADIHGYPQMTTDAERVAGMVYSKDWNKAPQPGKLNSLLAGGQFARDAINFGVAVNNSFKGVKHEPELLGDSGLSNDLVMGIGYRRQNYIDRGAELKDLRRENVNNTLTTTATGAALGGSTVGLIGALGGLGAGAAAGAAGGSVVPIIGTAIGALVGAGIGLFAGSRRTKKLKRRIYDALTLANQQNIYNRGAAMTAGLQLNYGLDYSNTQDDILYANRGKDLRQPIFR